MTVSTKPPPVAQAEQVKLALRHFAARYVGARRASGELRSRLVALLHERKLATANREEIDRVRGTIERSTHVADERTRALEAVIAAVARQVDVTWFERPDNDEETGAAIPASFSTYRRPDAALRGGWSPPERTGYIAMSSSPDQEARIC